MIPIPFFLFLSFFFAFGQNLYAGFSYVGNQKLTFDLIDFVIVFFLFFFCWLNYHHWSPDYHHHHHQWLRWPCWQWWQFYQSKKLFFLKKKVYNTKCMCVWFDDNFQCQICMIICCCYCCYCCYFQLSSIFFVLFSLRLNTLSAIIPIYIYCRW